MFHYISQFNSQNIQWVHWLSLHLSLTISNITPLTKVTVSIPGDHYQHPHENLLGRKNLLYYLLSRKKNLEKIYSDTFTN